MSDFAEAERRRRYLQWITAALFPTVLIGGWFWPILGYFIPLCMVLGLGIGIFRGRQWCDWLCPRGAFFDAAAGPASPKRSIPRFVKGFPLRIVFIAFLMAMMLAQIANRWPDPYAIGMFFVTLLTATSIVGVVFALLVHPRLWCCLCPIGSMGNWFGRWRHPLRIDSASCTECGVCHKVCPIQVEPYAFKGEAQETVRDGDCLKCALCVAKCPASALSLKGNAA